VGRRVATFVAIALIHGAVLVNVALTQWRGSRTSEEAFVTHVFFITEAQPGAEEPASPAPAPSVRHAAPVLTAPITLPPEPPSEAAPSASPRIDWAREAELAATRQLQKGDEARRLAAPFAHDVNPQRPVRPAPQFHWNRASTNRLQPLETGGTLIWLNERCALVFAGAVLPVCALGKISAHGDLFEHMNDPPVLGEDPGPP
jgi:hypothetical protein